MIRLVSSSISSNISVGVGRSIFPLSVIPIQDYQNLVLIACTNGSIALFNIEKSKIEFQTEPGHSETVFDLKFCPLGKNILASWSYDGTIKVWNASSMRMIHSIHNSKKKSTFGHSTLQKAGGDNIIYCISWAPNSELIWWIWGKGIVKVFDTKKGILKTEIKPGTKGFRIEWNHLDPEYIISSSNNGNAYLLTFDENNDLILRKTYNHKGLAVYGVSWNHFNPAIFATGCEDGIIRIYDINNEGTSSILDLKKHSKRVFNIVWHPHSENILASGSNDKTIKVWNITDNSIITLEGHTNFVRGIVWSYEIPWFLASGSWDAQIRIWDTRIGAWIAVLEDHHADIYGLDTHPDRPFVFASCSRDNSIRFWNSEGLINNFKIQAISNFNSFELLDKPDESLILSSNSNKDNFSSVIKMCGKRSASIFQKTDIDGKENYLDWMM